MKEHMQYIIDHADEIEKLLKVKAQVSEVKSIMLENIDKAIERGENLTILSGKTENLRDSVSLVDDFLIIASVKCFKPCMFAFRPLSSRQRGLKYGGRCGIRI
uniref:Vesicle-associated membrane protein 724 n=1 Tax=Solanum tuberosum TaxID=4113 RepID=M1ASU7_SOLTU